MAITKVGAVLLVVGLVVGVVAGYGVGFIVYQPQIFQLQSNLSETQASLSETQSALSKSQSEAESLRGQLAECEEFKSDVASLISSLKKKLDLETQFVACTAFVLRGETKEPIKIMLGLGPYVGAVGDAELSTLLDEMHAYLAQGNTAAAMAKFADLMERNSTLIQSDLSKLDTILKQN